MSKLDTCYEAADLVDAVVSALGIRPTSVQRSRAEADVIERLDRLWVKWIARDERAAAKRAGGE